MCERKEKIILRGYDCKGKLSVPFSFPSVSLPPLSPLHTLVHFWSPTAWRFLPYQAIFSDTNWVSQLYFHKEIKKKFIKKFFLNDRNNCTVLIGSI